MTRRHMFVRIASIFEPTWRYAHGAAQSRANLEGSLGYALADLTMHWRCLVVCLLLITWTGLAHAQQRAVIVNGLLLNSTGLALVDQLNCGDPVPNGNYWLDASRKEWGYVGVPGRNALPSCRDVSAQRSSPEDDCKRRYRYWEDRMVYCHGQKSEDVVHFPTYR